MPASIVMVFLTVPAEARDEALRWLSSAEAGYEDVTATTAASFVESGDTQRTDTELLLVSARAAEPPTPALAENFWRSIEATLFRDGVSVVEHMVAYAVPAD